MEIKTWLENMDTYKWQNVAMQQEINELRAALVKRVPLSDDSALQIVSDNAICSEYGDNHGYVTLTESKAICLVRAIEAAHNINWS